MGWRPTCAGLSSTAPRGRNCSRRSKPPPSLGEAWPTVWGSERSRNSTRRGPSRGPARLPPRGASGAKPAHLRLRAAGGAKRPHDERGPSHCCEKLRLRGKAICRSLQGTPHPRQADISQWGVALASPHWQDCTGNTRSHEDDATRAGMTHGSWNLLLKMKILLDISLI